MTSARYFIGIDLGTTHTVVAYTAIDDSSNIDILDIDQLIALGEVAARPLLPSLRYHAAPGEIAAHDTVLPWGRTEADGSSFVVGELARNLGAKVPGRLVVSAKSWLSHPAVDRSAAILPWGASDDVPKVSPLAASASYLAHVRAAWNHRHPQDPIERQHVVLTVPASFDEAARAYTLEAASMAGLAKVRLLEEPQAACYDWLYRHQQDAKAVLAGKKLLLVCDVGGGTTDLTLIQIDYQGNELELTRVGVGDHLMLGGDNMDLTLAHIAEARLAQGAGAKLSTASFSQLVQQCQAAKERFLAADAPETATVTVLGAGAKLIGGARSVEFGKSEVQQLLLDGFFPASAANEQPQRRRAGIVEFGLPYVADPAITRHIAAFLAKHTQAAAAAFGVAEQNGVNPVPDVLLLNGGVFQSSLATARLIDVLAAWRGNVPAVLDNDRPDLAVARGAVAYQLAKRGSMLRIGGGAPRSYFVIVQSDVPGDKQAVCLLPKGTPEGQEVQLSNKTFALRLGEPVQFHVASKSGDGLFQAGETSGIDQNLHLLPPIMTVLRDERSSDKSREAQVQLAAQMTEIGTLEVACLDVADPARRWRLEFQLRAPAAEQEQRSAAQNLPPQLPLANEKIQRVFGSRSQQVEPREVKILRNELEKILGKRDEWDTTLLRELYATVWEGLRHRRRSADHERQWFNLVGFCLRPGFGHPLDEWRVQQLWSLYGQGVQFAKEPQVWAEWWTLWRRVAGGLNEQQQAQIVSDIEYYLLPVTGAGKKRPAGPKKQGYDDMVRLVAGLERLPANVKVDIGNGLLEKLKKPAESNQGWWAVGRIGARVPFYGSAHHVVPPEVAAVWLERVLALDWHANKAAPFAAVLLSRMSGDRARDLDENLRFRVCERLKKAKSPASWVSMVEQMVILDKADEQRVFGETLPPGLRLLH